MNNARATTRLESAESVVMCGVSMRGVSFNKILTLVVGPNKTAVQSQSVSRTKCSAIIGPRWSV